MAWLAPDAGPKWAPGGTYLHGLLMPASMTRVVVFGSLPRTLVTAPILTSWNSLFLPDGALPLTALSQRRQDAGLC